MASIELVANAADWKDNSSGTPLPAGKWTVAANKLVLTNSVVTTAVYDYGPDRLATDQISTASVFYRAPPSYSPFMAKTSGHLVVATTVTSLSVPLADVGVYHLVEAASYSGAWFFPAVRALSAGACIFGGLCDTNFPGGDYSFVGLGFVPWHIPTDQPLAAYLAASVTWSLEVSVYWTDSFLVPPPFWQNFLGQREVL